MNKPNILWICTDQQRFDTLGAYGNPWVNTPNLDALAESGMVFKRAYCQSTVCVPSRSSFMTGRYPRTTRCRQNGQDIPEDEVLVTRLLDESGYACGLAGKLHLSAANSTHNHGTERRINDGYSVFNWSHHPYQKWGTATNHYQLWLRERGVPYEHVQFEDSRYVETNMTKETHQSAWCVQKAMEFIEECDSFERPWEYSINFFDPHHPFDPPMEFLKPYLDKLDDIPLPVFEEQALESKPTFQKEAYDGKRGFGRYPSKKMSERDHRLTRAAYWAMVDCVDYHVGRLLAFLEEKKLRENTIIIFMSDHGEMLGDHGIYTKGCFFYEQAVRVPLIFSCPGLIESGETSELVELTDIAPTLLEAAGLPRYEGMQGKSLWPYLTDPKKPYEFRDDVYCEFYNGTWHFSEPQAHATMVATKRYKLVKLHGIGEGELYDLESDPDELNNLWDASDCRDVKLEMLDRLSDRMAWTVDPVPPRLAEW